ncbi:histidine kinase [uncultured Marixanthomonas sp.]|uniref:sensor histidine kinase n=1 Tax=uncultured Marixanthomonas sp. TaxID=757245 RepID=UPI0030D85F39|tara:strand:- start:115674 stop:116492 length:819 start_codon:yes stop_codon:yes gene_type:complete
MVEELLFQEDYQIVDLILIAIALLVAMAVAIILFFYFSRKRIIKSELEKANLKIANQKEILQTTIITQEEERKRIAQDLHDAISSKLNIVSLNANMLSLKDISSEETNKIANSILKVTGNVLESSRKIAHDLLPPTLDKFGLEAALEELCEEVADTNSFEVNCNLQYPEHFLNKDKELHVFRIVQELFNNSIKYSEATNLTLKTEMEGKQLLLYYSDNGKGFDVSIAKKAKGLGMSGIENRVAILNATHTIISSPDNGISVTLALNPSKDEN